MEQQIKVGMTVLCNTEHPQSIGTVTREAGDGFVIEWVTKPSSLLPYGAIGTEFWSASELHLLTVVK